MRTGTVAGCRGATALMLGARLLLAAAAPDASAEPAQPATEVGNSVRDLKAALDEIKRRVEQQRQGAGTAPAGERAERENVELRTTALASVQQVRSAGDQLLAALAERGRLTVAEEPRSGGAPQLTAEGEGTGTAAPLVREASDRAGGPASAATGGGVRDKAVLDGDLFAAGGDRLAAGAAEPLARVARLIKGTRGEVRIVGHTDPGGDPKRNLQASVRRARAVRDYLVRTYGFDAGRFEVAAAGGEEPVTTDGTSVGRAASRRVEVLLSR